MLYASNIIAKSLIGIQVACVLHSLKIKRKKYQTKDNNESFCMIFLILESFKRPTQFIKRRSKSHRKQM